MLGVEPRRYGSYATKSYLKAKNEEAYANVFTVHYPDEEREAGRPLRQAPCYDRLKKLGAVFGAKFGWERANFFVKEGEKQATPIGRGRGFRYGFPNQEYYFKSQEEMKRLFQDLPDAILNIELSRVGVEQPGPTALSLLDLSNPDLEWTDIAKGMGMQALKVDGPQTCRP